jgi:hypothetical protein
MKHINDLLPASIPYLGMDNSPSGEGAIDTDALPAFETNIKSAEEQAEMATKAGTRVSQLKKTSLEILKQKTAAALQKKTEPEQQVLQLDFPQWDDDRRGVPNPLIRGGLFTTRMSAKRLSLKSEKIASLSNSNILYTGEELRQDDLTVWMSIVNLGRDQPMGDPIYFTAYKLIKDMKWRMHVDSYVRLRGCIDRLKVTSIKVTTKDDSSGYAGSLIRDYAFDSQDNNGHDSWVVRLEPTIVRLFPFDNTTLLEWEQRKQIGTRASLTLWLHTFYSSHREPLPYSVLKIHELCKSDEKKMGNFRARVRLSLETLIIVGLLTSYAITNDVIYVKRVRYCPRLAA